MPCKDPAGSGLSRPSLESARFFCWTRIDSLPQLINVMYGDLTIVGTGRRRPDFVD